MFDTDAMATEIHERLVEAARYGDCNAVRSVVGNVDADDRMVALGARRCMNGEVVALLHVAAVYGQTQVRQRSLYTSSCAVSIDNSLRMLLSL